jgi:hypothetical protein
VVNYLIDHILPARWRGRVKPLVQRFLSGLEALRSPQEALMIFFTTVVIWLLETSKYWFIMQSFPQFHVSFFSLMLMNGIVNLATTLPSAPGYVGTFDAPGIALLMAYGVPQGIAAPYTIVLHVALWFPVTIVGAYFYFRQPLRWNREISNRQEESSTGG